MQHTKGWQDMEHTGRTHSKSSEIRTKLKLSYYLISKCTAEV
jgi:hypothetical protein